MAAVVEEGEMELVYYYYEQLVQIKLQLNIMTMISDIDENPFHQLSLSRYVVKGERINISHFLWEVYTATYQAMTKLVLLDLVLYVCE